MHVQQFWTVCKSWLHKAYVQEQQKHINNLMLFTSLGDQNQTAYTPIQADRQLSYDYDCSQQQGPSQQLIQIH